MPDLNGGRREGCGRGVGITRKYADIGKPELLCALTRDLRGGDFAGKQ